MSSLRDAIRQLADMGTEMYCKVCVVDAVDEQARTIDCTPLDESAPLVGVNLQANQDSTVGIVSFPAIGAWVVVAFLSDAVGVVILADEITKTVYTIGDTEIVVEDKHISGKNGKVQFEVLEDAARLDVDGTTLAFDGEKTVFNDGSETTANASELKKQLTTMSGRIDSIIKAIGSAAVAPMDGGATFKTNLSLALQPHLSNKEDFSQIIDDKIQH